LRLLEAEPSIKLAKKAECRLDLNLVKLQRGNKKNPSLPMRRKLAKALGVPVTELLG
jgi:hypothetical protein